MFCTKKLKKKITITLLMITFTAEFGILIKIFSRTVHETYFWCFYVFSGHTDVMYFFRAVLLLLTSTDGRANMKTLQYNTILRVGIILTI